MGHTATSGSPNTLLFSNQQNQEGATEEQRGRSSPQIHIPHLKLVLLLPTVNLPFSREDSSHGTSAHNNFACILS